MPDKEINALLRKMHSKRGKAIIVEVTPTTHDELKNMFAELEAEKIKELKLRSNCWLQRYLGLIADCLKYPQSIKKKHLNSQTKFWMKKNDHPSCPGWSNT